MKKIKLFLAASAVIAMASLASCAGSSKESAVQNDSVAVANGAEERAVWRSGVYELQAGEILDFSRNVNHPVVVDFNATWCGPCQAFKPTFEEMAKKYDGQIEFISVDVDRCPESAKAFDVSGIPHILFVATDGSISSNVGLMTPEEFESALQKLL